MQNSSNDYVTRVLASPLAVNAGDWNALHALQPHGSPFMRHEYLAALHESGSATPATGWTPRFVTLWRGDELHAACALYLKTHSYGEYVFDWAWANAYEQHGLRYYPKALVAVPFTPVPGPRLLAIDPAARQALIAGLVQWCQSRKLSSLHLLFAAEADVAACEQAGLPVNVVDDPERSNAIVPAIVDRSPLVIAVSKRDEGVFWARSHFEFTLRTLIIAAPGSRSSVEPMMARYGTLRSGLYPDRR